MQWELLGSCAMLWWSLFDAFMDCAPGRKRPLTAEQTDLIKQNREAAMYRKNVRAEGRPACRNIVLRSKSHLFLRNSFLGRMVVRWCLIACVSGKGLMRAVCRDVLGASESAVLVDSSSAFKPRSRRSPGGAACLLSFEGVQEAWWTRERKSNFADRREEDDGARALGMS